jgi:predicted N-formylglutamate amidohydrolase
MTRESHPGIVHALLSPEEPGPFRVLNPLAEHPVLLICDHASYRFPKYLHAVATWRSISVPVL